MTDLPSLKEHIKESGHLTFVNACLSSLNDFKLKQFQDGLSQNMINLSILLKKNDSEMEKLVTTAGNFFTGAWWANIAGGKINFIEDNESNRKIALQMNEKISHFTQKDVMYFSLKEWISINKKMKLFSHKITKVDDFFKKKETDAIAYTLWWANYYITLISCHTEPKGMRKILCLKKSFLGKWSKYQIQFK